MSKVDHPAHYNASKVETIEMMERVYGKEAVYNFCLCNALKYRMRAGHKEDMQEDIEKALWYERYANVLIKEYPAEGVFTSNDRNGTSLDPYFSNHT